MIEAWVNWPEVAGRIERQPSGCVYWTGNLSVYGYAMLSIRSRKVRAFRWIWERLNGPVPPGHVLDHICHNDDPTCPGGRACLHRRCVNPAHGEPITSPENVRRGFARRRTCKNGHPWTSENTYLKRGKWKVCRTCHRDEERARRAHG